MTLTVFLFSSRAGFEGKVSWLVAMGWTGGRPAGSEHQARPFGSLYRQRHIALFDLVSREEEARARFSCCQAQDIPRRDGAPRGYQNALPQETEASGAGENRPPPVLESFSSSNIRYLFCLFKAGGNPRVLEISRVVALATDAPLKYRTSCTSLPMLTEMFTFSRNTRPAHFWQSTSRADGRGLVRVLNASRQFCLIVFAGFTFMVHL